MSGSARERRMQADYLKVDGEFEFLGAGFEELNESPGAKTTSKRYIHQKSETASITSYSGAHDFSIDQMKSEKAIKFICGIGKMRKTGADAESEYIAVDIDTPSNEENTYYARKFNVAIEVKDFKSKDGEMQGSGSFSDKGDPIEGTFNTETRKFKPGWKEPQLGTLTVTSTAGTNSGYTKIAVTEPLTSGNTYCYFTDTKVSLPAYADVMSGYSSWNGTSEIAAENGNEITIIEINNAGLAVKAGKAVVVVKA